MSADLMIEDGYTATRTIPSVAGLHPELRVMYRPALAKERLNYRAKGGSGDPTVLDVHEVELIVKHLVSVNGQEFRDKEKVARLKPTIRQHLVDLVLGFAPEDESRTALNLG